MDKPAADAFLKLNMNLSALTYVVSIGCSLSSVVVSAVNGAPRGF